MLIKEGSTPKDFKTSFVNLKTKRYTIVRNKDGKDEFPMMNFFSKNILYACVSPEDIGKYVRVNLLDDPSKEIFKMRPKQSNYYVLKYYLK